MFWYLRWFFVLGGFPPPKPLGVCFFGIDYLVGLARGGLTKYAISNDCVRSGALPPQTPTRSHQRGDGVFHGVSATYGVALSVLDK